MSIGFLQALFDYLDGVSALGLVAGTDWHFGTMPADAPDLAVALQQRVPAKWADAGSDGWVPVQLWARGPSYITTEAKISAIFEAIRTLRGVQLTDWWLYDVTGTGPAFVGRDETNRHEFTANLTCSVRRP